MFAIRQVCEKYLANWKYVLWAFTDLEKDRSAWYEADATSVWSWRSKSPQ